VNDPILASKITAPGVPGWALQRPRITRLVAEGTRRCALTVVSGPLGAGKTMALTLWAAKASGPVAWVAVDRYDNRPGVFWPYVVAALRKAGVAMPKALSATGRGRTAERTFVLRLASVLAGQDRAVTLVVDDFHLLTGPRVPDGLEFLLRNAGGGLRLVVASRAAPLLPLHRYRLAGELAEIGPGDLAFSVAEAGHLLARHGCELSAGSVECLMRLTEGWAAGLRLAGITLAARSDPERFVKELVTQDSALTAYLVQEVLDTEPRETREVLLSTSILEQVNSDLADELADTGQGGRILADLAHANAFVHPLGGGWYRFHPLFAQMLRLRLRVERPGRVHALHRQAARWYERNGRLAHAVRHAAQAGAWQLAARMVINGLAIGEIIEPRAGRSLAGEFAGMPDSQAWTEPQPYLVLAAVALADGRLEPAAAWLDAAEAILGRLPAEQQTAARLAAALIRRAAALRNGDLTAAAQATARLEALVGVLGVEVARRPEFRAYVLSARGTVELWSGRFDEAARALDSGAAAAAASGDEQERADCLGKLALAEALRGRLTRAAKLADQVTAAGVGDDCRSLRPAAVIALAWVHLERHELREARGMLKHADAALAMSPDKLTGALACLMVACDRLAEGRADVAAQFVARARLGWHVPAWLERKLSLVESRAYLAAGDIPAALAAASRGEDNSPEAAVMLARVQAAAGNSETAQHALDSVLAAHDRSPDRVRLQACLADAWLGYRSGDGTRGRRSLGCALRLAEREKLRLPFAMERGWIEPVLERDPELAVTHRHLVGPVMRQRRLPAAPCNADGLRTPVVEPLTDREQEVLRHVSGMLTTAEIASELHISTNTVKSHIKNICHKLTAAHRGEAVRRARQLQLI